ncbi:phage major capsid protein [Paenisporosarcina cavernae]|uniref:Phage major capsid protein n=1 Tax=Paenisporosarcina cavernae TaxID=2320858 RepID=A0A385YPQ2_9BACL|nr:phage major capsid protein [Paenisporosarcina cavernae]AYC28719.1 phage major capsid protein [Paenisporosarcina cavernae]
MAEKNIQSILTFPLSLANDGLQFFATQTYTPDDVLMSDAKSGNIPEETGGLIIEDVIKGSTVMKLAKNEPMTKPKKTFSFKAKGAGAYWVSETEVIKTSKVEWLTASMTAEKLAVIIPFSKEFLRYTAKEFFNEVKPLIAEAFYETFDIAALFGTNSPFATHTSGKSIFTGATDAGNLIALGSGDDLQDEVFDAMALIEAGGFNPDGATATNTFKQNMRRAKNVTNGERYYTNLNDLEGMALTYAKPEAFDTTKAAALIGDWDYARYGILQGIEYAVSEDAQLSSVVGADGKPINLFERDMFALRATMHIGYMNVKPEAFAALTPEIVTP